MMGIVVPEICWASNKICNKNHLLHLVGILFPHINDDALSKSHQMRVVVTVFSWRTEVSLCSLAAEKTSGCKQSAQSSLCKAAPRSRTECGIVRSSSASVRNAFLCREPKSSCKFKNVSFQLNQYPLSVTVPTKLIMIDSLHVLEVWQSFGTQKQISLL